MADPLIVPCLSCGSLNRLPAAAVDRVPLCADCGAHLLDQEPPGIDARLLRRLIDKSDLPVVVDFWAAWCGPCRKMAPDFAAAARQLVGKALLVKVDTEAEPALAGQLELRSIPTLIAFRHGRELARVSGALPAPEIVRFALAQRD